jgi:hypothetical protein
MLDGLSAAGGEPDEVRPMQRSGPITVDKMCLHVVAPRSVTATRVLQETMLGERP